MGLVTVDGAIEQIIGEVEDEFIGRSAAAHRLRRSDPGRGGEPARPGDADDWQLPRRGGVETLAGFMLTRLGKIPTREETGEFQGRRFTVLEMSENRISQVRIERMENSSKMGTTAAAKRRARQKRVRSHKSISAATRKNEGRQKRGPQERGLDG